MVAQVQPRVDGVQDEFSNKKPMRAAAHMVVSSLADPPVVELSSSDEFLLFLNRRVFIMCWCIVLVLHSVNGAFLIATTKLYTWLLRDESDTHHMLVELDFDIKLETLNTLSWGFAILGGVNVLIMLRIFYESLRAKRLVFWATPTSTSTSTSTSPAKRLSADPSKKTPHSRMDNLMRSCVGRCEQLVQRWIKPYMFIDGKHFDDYFVCQEYLEVVAQVYQAHRMSIFIATRWINDLAVGMIFLNCISTPLIHRVVPRSNVPLRRLIEVMASSFLNFVNSVVIPFVIFIKYVQEFDLELDNFPRHDTYNDVWYAKALHENQQVFVTSPFDFVTTFLPHCSLLSCLMICESMLFPRSVRSSAEAVVSVIPVHSDQLPIGKATPIDGRHRHPHPHPAHSSHTHHRENVVARMLRYNVLWITGCVILGIHIDSQRVAAVHGCALHATPWFARGKSSCVIMNVNCYRLGIQGTTEELTTILTPLNRKTLLTLLLTHCPAIEIPPAIQTFHAIDGLEIFNSTLQDWPIASALHDDFFPVMSYVYFIQSNLSAIPAGMLQATFPTNVKEVYLYGTNLTSLPDEIPQKWPLMEALVLEFNHFHEIPSPVFEMPLFFLCLTGNPITSVTRDLFVNTTLYHLYLSSTPLRALPTDTTGNFDQIFKLMLEFTQLEVIPSYIQDWYHDNSDWVRHSLFGSPFCNRTLDDPREQAYQQGACQDLGYRDGYFPIAIVAPQRPL